MLWLKEDAEFGILWIVFILQGQIMNTVILLDADLSFKTAHMEKLLSNEKIDNFLYLILNMKWEM